MKKEASSQEVILSNKFFCPQVTKVFYLLIFLISTLLWVIYAFSQLFHSLYLFTKSTETSLLTVAPLYIALFIAGVMWVAHMVRLYFSLENLDDPHSDSFKKYLRPLTHKWRLLEQLIRFAFFGIVSLKLLELYMKSGISNTDGTDLTTTFFYITLIYLFMLIWDIHIALAHLIHLMKKDCIIEDKDDYSSWISHLKQFLSKTSLKYIKKNILQVISEFTYWKSSLSGLIVASYIYYNAPNGTNLFTNYLELVGVIFGFVTAGAFILWSLKDTYGSFKGIVIGMWKHLHKDFWADFKSPYFGQACTFKVTVIDGISCPVNNGDSCPLPEKLEANQFLVCSSEETTDNQE